MLEIVFESGAIRSLQRAQGFEKGEIHGFPLMWGIGAILEDKPGEMRRETLLRIFSPDVEGQTSRIMAETAASYKKVLERAAAGEALRIWYSEQPDELCGFYWMMAQLDGLKNCSASMVRLPLYMEQNGEIAADNHWGEAVPEGWRRSLPLEQPVSHSVRRAAAWGWKELQEENAPLRAVVNGSLISVPGDFYDSFIRAELPPAGEEFSAARMIGRVMGRQLRISGFLIVSRINAMIEAGELERIEGKPEGRLSCGCTLRRVR